MVYSVLERIKGNKMVDDCTKSTFVTATNEHHNEELYNFHSSSNKWRIIKSVGRERVYPKISGLSR